MKKSLILFAFSICILGFVSAYHGSYYGGGFSLSDLLNEIDEETMLLGVTFIISFALINLSLSKALSGKGDVPKAVPAVVAFCLALGITWGINKNGFDLEDFFYSLGFSSDVLFTVIPLLLAGFLIFSVIKWGGNGFIGLGITLAVFGAIFFEEKTLSIFLGVIIFLIGMGINKWFPKKEGRRWYERSGR